MKLFNLVLCLFLFSFSWLYANKSNEMYADISISAFQENDLHTDITLNNGTIWTYLDVNLFEEPYSWQIGDRIQIVYVHGLSGQYYLQNMCCSGYIPVTFTTPPVKTISITNIEIFYENEHITSQDLTFSDSSVWHVVEQCLDERLESWRSCDDESLRFYIWKGFPPSDQSRSSDGKVNQKTF